MEEAIGGAAVVAFYLLVFLGPAFVVLWLGLRTVRALERSARAQELLLQRVSELTLLMVEARRANERDRPAGL